ncbi:MAG TPA: hypothetical protein HPQ03_16145 [Deltaproteobacteria bacterium]|nr:hypothetical protein [Deltaproteobacteria bacterium]
MALLELEFPIHTLNNRCLFAEGGTLDPETLASLIDSDRIKRYPKSDLSKYGSLNKDTLSFLKVSPYDKIFDDPQIGSVLETMLRVRLPQPALEYLDYFQENDPYTYRHLIIVYALSIILAKDLIGDEDAQYRMFETGPSHDFGKSCTPLSVLKKETPLTRNERAMLEHHVAAGYVIMGYYLKDAECLSAALARDHHERKDGSGYPAGIHLDDIQTEIIIASDVYDALISQRPYREVSYDNRTALEEITGMAERGEIGWEPLQALIGCNREGRPHYTEVNVSLEKRGTPPAENVYGIREE